MTTTIFCTGDWHADWHTDGYERFEDVERAVHDLMERVLQAKHDEGVNDRTVLLFGGDLTNPLSRNVHRAAALALRVAMKCAAWQVTAFFMTGNHDVQEDGHNSHALLGVKEYASRSGYVIVVERPAVFKLDQDGCIMLLPFTSNAWAYDPKQFVVDAADPMNGYKMKLIAGHLSLPGIIAGSETTAMPRGRNVDFPLAEAKRLFPKAVLVNHHYHDQQMFEGVHIPGSLVRLTHGEEKSTPGYLVVSV